MMLREIFETTTEVDAPPLEGEVLAYAAAVVLWLLGVAGLVVYKLRAA